ncbi:BA14K-like protein [Faunimonas pinastri]|uniref:Lectin-like protein BA14k n=1 Tax=Faunimonas pinastri TaxID=1855383 RepID=A0A1H9M2E6_9HYPH|nr:BA14K family protein [Faunimonas pinastri]SER17665.1 BA14K-like protein [Faunimonas pinastri]
MRKTMTAGLAAAMALTATAFAPAYAGMASMGGDAGVSAPVQQVQYYGNDWRGGPPPPPRGHWDRDDDWRRHHRHHGDAGAAVAAGAVGLAAGAIIAGQANRDRGTDVSGYVSYCSQRYRSFDPNSGTYLGSDGLRHRCVAP